MYLASGWKDYAILDAGNGDKFERWADVTLLRPDPQAVWTMDERVCERADAVYHRSSSGGGHWEYKRQLPEQRREQAHLGIHGNDGDPVDRQGIAGEHRRRVREPVPEMPGHPGQAVLSFRVHGRDLHLGEIPLRRRRRNVFPTPGSAGAKEGNGCQDQVFTHFP